MIRILYFLVFLCFLLSIQNSFSQHLKLEKEPEPQNVYTGEYQWMYHRGQLKWFDKVFGLDQFNKYTKGGTTGIYVLKVTSPGIQYFY